MVLNNVIRCAFPGRLSHNVIVALDMCFIFLGAICFRCGNRYIIRGVLRQPLFIPTIVWVKAYTTQAPETYIAVFARRCL